MEGFADGAFVLNSPVSPDHLAEECIWASGGGMGVALEGRRACPHVQYFRMRRSRFPKTPSKQFLPVPRKNVGSSCIWTGVGPAPTCRPCTYM